jgi:SAM-dependent methyltransferase
MAYTARMDLRLTFNTAADLYDRIRPTYPPQLIDDVIRDSGIPPAGSILEIGCGTGKATGLFAQRGYRMLCLDIGADMVRIAAQRLQSCPDVEFEVTSFEDWRPGERTFDLAIAATSFHWLQPTLRFSRTASVLRPDGALAVFSNQHVDREEGFRAEVQECYRVFAPSICLKPGSAASPPTDENEARASGMECGVERAYPWTATYSAGEYLSLLGTYSGHIALADDQRSRLFAAIAELIDRRFGGRIVQQYECILRLYRRLRR